MKNVWVWFKTVSKFTFWMWTLLIILVFLFSCFLSYCSFFGLSFSFISIPTFWVLPLDCLSCFCLLISLSRFLFFLSLHLASCFPPSGSTVSLLVWFWLLWFWLFWFWLFWFWLFRFWFFGFDFLVLMMHVFYDACTAMHIRREVATRMSLVFFLNDD